MIWTVLGVLYILAGLTLNEFTVVSWLSPDGMLRPLTRAALWAFDAGLLIWGAVTLRLRRHELVRNLNVTLLSVALLCPLAAEAFLRAMIAARHPKFAQPSIYADYVNDDLYWLAEYHWTDKWEPAAPDRVHPLLGWSQERVSAENPFGLEEPTRSRLRDDGRRKVLFYGDSFVKGGSAPEFQIPRYLDDRTPDADVLDLGVGGYGTDQAYLMFRETHALAGANPAVVMGVLTEDLDRAVLTVRTSQKPYFDASRGRLRLRGLPIARDQKAYYDARPPRPFSYLFRYLSHWASDNPQARERTRRVNRLLFDAVAGACREKGLPLLYVLFYGDFELKETFWRETFLKEELARRGIEFVDTKAAILAHAAREGLPISAYYVPGDGHHNDLGNRVIGDAVLAALEARGLA